jgi:hypothetical protein
MARCDVARRGRQGNVWRGWSRSGNAGMEGRGNVRRGRAWYGRQGQAWCVLDWPDVERQVRRGWARPSAVWTGMAGEDGFVRVWSGGAGCGPARQAWHRKDRLGKFRIGTAGKAGRGTERRNMEWTGRQGPARPGVFRCRDVRQAWHGKAWCVQVWQARCRKAWRSEERQG